MAVMVPKDNLPPLARAALAAALAALAACGASTNQEVEMGQQAAAQATHQLPMVHDPEIDRYINILGDSLASVADTRGLEWHFYIVNSPEVNAFALPGGFVFVNRGLIERVDSLDELAGVLGHEIGHVTMRHSVKMQQKGEVAEIGTALSCILTRMCGSPAMGEAINVGTAAAFSSFSRDAEHQADSVGMIYVVRAGIDPRGMTSMFEKLLAERKRDPEKLEAWFMTHPAEEYRIAFTLDAIAKMDRRELDRLTRDTPNFRKFKERFAGLPPYPPQPSN
jgi:beta-barrel assembly-enhancing protease